jgi:hypothetical protein
MITELKPLHILSSSIEYEDGTHDSGSDYDVYDKDAVDAVLKEKDAEIARLNQELTDRTSVSAITCNATLITIRKLLRALWTVRMKFMWSECRWFSACNPDYIRNREGYTPNSSKEKQMGSLQWARLFYKNYESCKRQVEKFNS